MRYLALVAVMLIGCGGGERGTLTWAPGVLKPNAVASADVPVPSAQPGNICQAGVMAPAPSTGVAVACIISSKGVCSISVRNQGSSDLALGLATFYCYVWPD